MRKCKPYHSSQHPGVYHVYSDCYNGNNIETHYRTPGAKGRLCRTCRRFTRSHGSK